MKNNYKVVGMMSGTSLDGLDIVLCGFKKDRKKWDYRVLESHLLKYPRSIASRLAGAHQLNSQDLAALDFEYGHFLGKACRNFLSSSSLNADFIASHGHTVLHEPAKGFTVQIGNGNAIHAASGLPVVWDFRSLDVALGGQGAPLVPAGDQLLYGDYDICLNLGGIANLSVQKDGVRKAFDICFCNMLLNHLMRTVGKNFDKGGELAAQGEVNTKMFSNLGRFYKSIRKRRPSLGREVYDTALMPLLKGKVALKDKLATAVESTAAEIALAAKETGGREMFCTGGGVFNSYLMSRILEFCGDDISLVIPDEEVIKFKEAIIFAFLGVMRVRGEVNCLRSVTGASRDSSGGVLTGF